MKISQIGPLWRTVKYLKPHQILARLEYKTRSLYFSSPLYPTLEDEYDVPTELILSPPNLWKGSKTTGKDILENKFHFIGRTINMGRDIRWYPNEASTLWVYNLHYFEWLKHLQILEDEGRREAQLLLESWLDNCSTFNKVGWHPYPISLRLINWFTHHEWMLDGARDDLKKKFIHSIVEQTNMLEKTIEWDVGGNHIIKNLKALIYAGLCLPGRQTTFLDALNILTEQLNIQVLPDGGHYERSPHYHADVLKDLLDVVAIIRRAGQQPPAKLLDAVDRMGEALKFYTYPDGELGLFNDGETNNAKHIKELLKQAHINNSASQLPDTGYAKLQRKKSMLMIDGGICCPNELPAHAHADMLSFELCVGNERIFVNSGTFAYQHELRNKLRGTAAHNTVEIDGEDSAEVWDTFRLGRRPHNVRAMLREEKGVGVGVDAFHDGYKHLGINHNRKIFMSEDGDDIRGEDIITSKNKKTHTVKAYFHLHPDVTFSLKGHNDAVLKTKSGLELSFKISGGRLYDMVSNYSPSFGVKEPNSKLVIQGKWEKNKCTIRWAIKKV